MCVLAPERGCKGTIAYIAQPGPGPASHSGPAWPWPGIAVPVRLDRPWPGSPPGPAWPRSRHRHPGRPGRPGPGRRRGLPVTMAGGVSAATLIDRDRPAPALLRFPLRSRPAHTATTRSGPRTALRHRPPDRNGPEITPGPCSRPADPAAMCAMNHSPHRAVMSGSLRTYEPPATATLAAFAASVTGGFTPPGRTGLVRRLPIPSRPACPRPVPQRVQWSLCAHERGCKGPVSRRSKPGMVLSGS